MATFSGDFRTPPGRFAIVAARFNWFIVEHLLGGAMDGFLRHGVSESSVDVIHTPGSLEIALVAKRLAQSNQYRAVICLGAILRGDTDHYDVVVRESAKGLSQVSLETGIPIMNAVLTVDTLEQAVHRAGAKAGNKGFDAAVAAIEMVNLFDKLPGGA